MTGEARLFDRERARRVRRTEVSKPLRHAAKILLLTRKNQYIALRRYPRGLEEFVSPLKLFSVPHAVNPNSYKAFIRSRGLNFGFLT